MFDEVWKIEVDGWLLLASRIIEENYNVLVDLRLKKCVDDQHTDWLDECEGRGLCERGDACCCCLKIWAQDAFKLKLYQP